MEIKATGKLTLDAIGTLLHATMFRGKSPVSYTHLDVYKRQVHHRAVRGGAYNRPRQIRQPDRDMCRRVFASLLPRRARFLHGVEAVSYTHLDVYKRQV